jgi:hypothetical protein
MTDLIVEEVRKVRAEHAAHFDNDLHRIVADLKSRQKRHGNRLVRLPAKPLPNKNLDRTR